MSSKKKDQQDTTKELEKIITAHRNKESPKLLEDPFTRIAYIVDREGDDEISTAISRTGEQLTQEKISTLLRSANIPTKQTKSKPIDLPPFYLPSTKNLNTISRVARVLQPVGWVVYLCNSKADLMDAISLTRLGSDELYNRVLKKHGFEAAINYVVLKNMYGRMTRAIDEIESKL